MMNEKDQTTRSEGTSKWLRRILPLGFLLLGAIGTIGLVKMRNPPQRKKRPKTASLVEVIAAQFQQRQAQVVSNGVIQPSREVAVVPEVSGRIRYLNPNLVIGGRIRKGAVLMSIDPTDFKLAVERARAQVAQAERSLALAKSNARVARDEWGRMGQQAGGKPSPLTLHEPQLKEAEAMSAAAQADLEMARINLQRTTFRAPFNLRVRSEQMEIEQYVRVGQELARVYGTDVAEVIVPLPVSELRWLTIPAGGKGEGATVKVRLKTGAAVYERQGTLIRSVGEVDATGRMSKVVVAIRDPYNLQRAKDQPYQPDFEIGSFVEVVFQGREIDKVMPLPAEAIRRGSRVWLVGPGDRLLIREVTVAKVDAKEALVIGGLQPGERVVVSNLADPAEGMALRIKVQGRSTPSRPPEKAPHPPEARRPQKGAQEARRP